MSKFMREALREAAEAVRTGSGGPFGAVVVLDGCVIGRGHNRVLSSSDPTAHAEVEAIREACRTLGQYHLDGAELYTSCEPCPMCLGAAYWAHIERIYFAAGRADAAAIGFADQHIYDELSRPVGERQLPMVGMMRDEAVNLFAQWLESPDKKLY
jgi:tRNA(Arg) A34 adenosine deaminase TadA